MELLDGGKWKCFTLSVYLLLLEHNNIINLQYVYYFCWLKYFDYSYHVTPVGPMKKFKVDGGVKLCFEKGHCEPLLDFKDLHFHYQTCNASNENTPFQGKCLVNKVEEIFYSFTQDIIFPFIVFWIVFSVANASFWQVWALTFGRKLNVFHQHLVVNTHITQFNFSSFSMHEDKKKDSN